MEFVDKFLRITKRKQEGLLSELGIQGEAREEFFPPKGSKAAVVNVDNDDFLGVLRTKRYNEVISKLSMARDAEEFHWLFVDIGEGVLIKTGVYTPHYGGQKNLFSDLSVMNYKYHSIELDPKWWPGWGIYKKEES